MERTDSQLLAACHGGDALAFEELYDRHSRIVYRVALLVTRSPEGAEEVTQDAFLALWRAAERYDPSRASVRTWLLRMTRNLAIDRCRRLVCEARANARWVASEPVPEPDPVGELVTGMAQAGIVRAAAAALPTDQRRIIDLSFVEGHSHAEIARELDIPLGTVKGRARLGLGRLRVALTGPLHLEHH
jgi:RNA polymerase sigma-70 factor, ECF subfamily